MKKTLDIYVTFVYNTFHWEGVGPSFNWRLFMRRAKAKRTTLSRLKEADNIYCEDTETGALMPTTREAMMEAMGENEDDYIYSFTYSSDDSTIIFWSDAHLNN